MIRLDEQTLRDLGGQNLSVAQIAYAMGTSPGTVQRNMARLGIARTGIVGGDRKSASFQALTTKADGYSCGTLKADALPYGRDDADARQWQERGRWPEGMHFEDARVPREAFLGKVGRGDAISGCSSAAAICAEGGGGSTGHWRVRRSL